MKHKIIFLALSLFIPLSSLFPQSFKYLNIENGLSSHRVLQLKKDATGFMWFLSYNGIDRYDGSEFKKYYLTSEKGTLETYLSSTKMVTDNDGNISISVQEGLIYRYNKDKDDFSLVLNMTKELEVIDIILNSIFYDPQNRLWICSNRGLYIYDFNLKKLQQLLLFDDNITTVIAHKTGNEYFVGTNQGIYILQDKGDFAFSVIEDNKRTENCGKIFSLYYNGTQLYIGTESQSAWILTNRNQLLSLGHIIPDNSIRSITGTRKGDILIGSDGEGVYCLDSKNNQLINRYATDDKSSEYGLRANSVYDILEDEYGYLWIGTYTNGATIIDPHSSGIRFIKHESKNSDSPVNSCINYIFEDSEGDIWYATNNGVSFHNEKTDEWKHYLNNLKSKAVVLAIAEDSLKRIWLGGYGMGAFCVDKKRNTITSYEKRTETSGKGLYTNHIYRIYSDEENVWLGGLGSGLTQYNIHTGNFDYHNIAGVSEIQQLNDSILIFGTGSGYTLFNRKTNIFTNYLNSGANLPIQAVRSIYIQDATKIWMGTEGNGILCLNSQTEEIDVYSKQDGLPSNNIYSLQVDDNDRLWITTENDLSYLDLKTKKIVNMTGYMGVGTLNYNPQASLKRSNGTMIFGTAEGAIVFTPVYEPEEPIHSKLIFTDFKLFYNSVPIGTEDSPLVKSINETESIVLKYNQNSFSYNFSSINFKYPGQISYLYKLDGFDQQWFTAQNNIVSYTNINPGQYSFRLRSTDKETGKTLEERVIKMTINKPFWESAWALLFYFLLAIGIAQLVLVYFKNKIEKRHSREKIQFFINVAHDIRTPVTLIKAPLSEIEEKEELSESGKAVLNVAIRNTDRLFGMVSQLLDFQKADLSALRLIVSRNELNNYIEEKTAHFKVEANKKSIELSSSVEIPSPYYVWFDREKMDRILNNLLSNAIKYTPEQGKIKITVGEENDKWHIMIKDNGIGIPASEQKFLFKRFFRAKNAINSKETGSGIGLLLTRKLVKLHRGDITFESREEAGTEFKVSFFQGDNYFKKSPLLEEYIGTHAPKVQLIENVPDKEEQEDTGKIKILLAEDNDEMRQYLAKSLGDIYHITEVTDGTEVIEKVPELNPDLIISDIMMNRLHGDEMCRQLKSSIETSHIPVILLTALADKENIIKGLDEGADDYITKPFDVSVLKARIRTILRNRQKIREGVLSTDIPNEEVEYIHPLDKEFIDKIVDLIGEHMDNSEYSINDLCSEMGMSRSSLYNKLKALTGQGPNDFIRIIRLNKAAELLESGCYNVIETCTLTGFSDSKYFSTAFKKQFGVSPSKYGKGEE